MTYEQRIDREHPSLVMMVLDQSYSMGERLPGVEQSKADALADVVNRIIYELVLRCVKDANEGPRHYYDIGLIGYGTDQTAASAWGGDLVGHLVASSVEAAHNPLRVQVRDDGSGRPVRSPVWYEPRANGATPMCAAFDLAGRSIADWIRRHQHSFPPVMIHVTDGDSTDGDPSGLAERIRQLATTDGQVLLFNLSLSSEAATPLKFPDSIDGIRSEAAHRLFNMSSILPPFMCDAARSAGLDAAPTARGFVHNADIAAVVSFFQVGTATVHQPI